MSIPFIQKNMSVVHGNTTSLFFKCVDSYGNGIDLSGGDASLVIKRYPTSPFMIFFMDDEKAFHGGSFGEFTYSPTADSNAVGISMVNEDVEGNSLTGGIVFPIYGGDSEYIPKGNHFYEVSVKIGVNRNIVFEGRIDFYVPSATGPASRIEQKNIEVAQGETTNLFFMYNNSFGNGIDLSGKKAYLFGRRYPSDSREILYISEQEIFGGDTLTRLEITSASGQTFSFINQDIDGDSLTGGIRFYAPKEITNIIPHGRYFYDVSISGGGTSHIVFDGRLDILPKFYTIPLTVESD